MSEIVLVYPQIPQYLKRRYVKIGTTAVMLNELNPWQMTESAKYLTHRTLIYCCYGEEFFNFLEKTVVINDSQSQQKNPVELTQLQQA